MPASDIHYAILGDGRLALHMHHYLGLLGQACSGWARNPKSPFNSHSVGDRAERLRRTIEPASHVLLLVRDDAIAPLVRQYPVLHSRLLVHCAGALSLPGIAGAHPLMTFGRHPYTLAEYQAIPFMVEGRFRFAELFPALPNPHCTVSVEHKALYHALCVMAGNFPQILWRAVGERFTDALGLPPEMLRPYLRTALENFLDDPSGALTGPLARGDRRTVQRNLAGLTGDPLQDLYRSFDDFYRSAGGRTNVGEKAS